MELLDRIAMLLHEAEIDNWNKSETADAILAIPEIREALGFRSVILNGRGAGMPEPEPDFYVRDADGTGSYHVCAKGDPGAVGGHLSSV